VRDARLQKKRGQNVGEGRPTMFHNWRHFCDDVKVKLPSAHTIRATPLVSPTRPPASFFSIRTAKNGPVMPPDPRFRPDLGLHPSGEPRPSPAFRGALGDSGRNKLARNRREYSRVFPRVVWPRPVGESGRSSSSSSRLPRIVFPARIVFRAL
jgi:hypothetical protein